MCAISINYVGKPHTDIHTIMYRRLRYSGERKKKINCVHFILPIGLGGPRVFHETPAVAVL